MKYAITSDYYAHEPHIVAFSTDAQRLAHLAEFGGECITQKEARRRLETQVRLAINYGCFHGHMDRWEVRILSMGELYTAYRRAFCY